jgi:hypothetical protein
MSWAVHAVMPLASAYPTDMSAGGLAVMVIVIVASLGALLIPVNLAARPPRSQRQNRYEQRYGPVQGGMHAGDPRSVLPHRDAPADEVSWSPGSSDQEKQPPTSGRGERAGAEPGNQRAASHANPGHENQPPPGNPAAR